MVGNTEKGIHQRDERFFRVYLNFFHNDAHDASIEYYPGTTAIVMCVCVWFLCDDKKKSNYLHI
jgi:hypothetical protein